MTRLQEQRRPFAQISNNLHVRATTNFKASAKPRQNKELLKSSIPETVSKPNAVVPGAIRQGNVQEIIGFSNVTKKIASRTCKTPRPCEDYTREVYVNARQREDQDLPKVNYMRKQPELTFEMRAVLLDWMAEVCLEYDIHDETFFLACNYIDRFLSLLSVRKSKLQLLGAVCLLVAAKLEEITPPTITELCYLTENAYSLHQMKSMERLLILTLKFRLSPPTSLDFATIYLKLGVTTLDEVHNEERLRPLTFYLLELMLLNGEAYLAFQPSILAAAAFASARKILGYPSWTTRLEIEIGYGWEEIQECLHIILKTFEKSFSDESMKALKKKYACESRMQVSSIVYLSPPRDFA